MLSAWEQELRAVVQKSDTPFLGLFGDALSPQVRVGIINAIATDRTVEDSEALAPLGYSLLMENTSGAGFGKGPIPDFWIKQGAPSPSVHIAFASGTRVMVDAFYRTALAAGASDNGPPGLRPHYHPNYYGAFVHDPDGYNIEAVCHQPE